MVVLDYTLFDFAGADELIVLQERFKEVDWILFSDEEPNVPPLRSPTACMRTSGNVQYKLILSINWCLPPP